MEYEIRNITEDELEPYSQQLARRALHCEVKGPPHGRLLPEPLHVGARRLQIARRLPQEEARDFRVPQQRENARCILQPECAEMESGAL